MYGKVMFAWRHLAQVGIGAVAAWLAGHGLGLDPATQSAVEAAAFGLGVWVYGLAVHWLESRGGTSPPAWVARALARVLMLGAPPVLRYAPPVPEAAQLLRARG